MLKRTKAYEFLKLTNFSLRRPILKEPLLKPAFSFKEYKNCEKISLDVRSFPDIENLFKIFSKRRSRRDYKRYEISLEELSLLCYAIQGVTGRVGEYLLRTAPSAGALYPIETYIAVNFSSEVKPGIYHLEIRDFSLALLKEGYFGRLLSDLALGQSFLATASLVFIWSAVLRRTIFKYGSRGLRYIFMDVAHICQNLLLACTALNLKACPIGAFFDEELNEFLELTEEESVVYMATVGK